MKDTQRVIAIARAEEDDFPLSACMDQLHALGVWVAKNNHEVVASFPLVGRAASLPNNNYVHLIRDFYNDLNIHAVALTSSDVLGPDEEYQKILKYTTGKSGLKTIFINNTDENMEEKTRAAVYARTATKNAPDNDGIDSQVRDALNYAKDQGWRVGDEHVFVDAGVSGCEFVNRKGLSELLSKASEFDAIIIRDLSRFGRDSTKVMYEVTSLLLRGKRIFCYENGEEILERKAPSFFNALRIQHANAEGAQNG